MGGFRNILKNMPLARRTLRWMRAHGRGYPRWSRILPGSDWQDALRKSEGGKKVLVATSVGAYLPGTTLESLLSVALTHRGAEVHVLLCDGVLPACLDSDVRWHGNPEKINPDRLTKHLCSQCFAPAAAMFRSLGVRLHRYGDTLVEEDRARAESLSREVPAGEIPGYRWEGISVGEHALAGALRFFGRGTLEGEPRGEGVLRKYFKAALLTASSVGCLLDTISFEVALLHHGIYIPQGIVSEVARKKSVRVVTWNPAYRKGCFIFSHGDTYHHTLMKEPVSTWENLAWSETKEKETVDYLKSRWQGSQDWIWFHDVPQEDVKAIEKEVGIDLSRPTVGLLTNVFWDAQLHYPANAFKNMLDWVIKTIDHFRERPDLQLLIRIHPAEVRGKIPSRQGMVEEIGKAFPELPENVFIVPPESQVSTYVAMSRCDSVIIYGTKTGVELTAMGIPVIVAGEAWIRNKGLTRDASSQEEYFGLLKELPFGERMKEEQVTRARKYAYHFFFRRMIPVDGLEPVADWPPYRVMPGAHDLLRPGKSRGLDVICDGVLKESAFVFPAEEGGV
jgi:hypothetical protein